jgi:glycosyltransferase involved in cell wall biosynthesis
LREKREKSKIVMVFSIVLPCLNEEETVGICVREALRIFDEKEYEGEVIVVDNASDDDSASVAEKAGAKVIREENRGYGNALRRGLKEASGDVIVLMDADTTYSFDDIPAVTLPIINGECDMVIGNRFGGMEKGAMSLSHRVGVRFLSAAARSKFRCTINDFHCGIRAVSKEALERLDLKTDGMEFATEMIAQACKKGLKIGEVPVKLKRCEYNRKTKLRTIRDGFRHLFFIYFQL